MDLIITEGFKSRDKPKIEVVRTTLSTELLCTPEELLAIVSDAEFDLGVPCFDLDDAAGIVDLLQRTYSLKPPSQK